MIEKNLWKESMRNKAPFIGTVAGGVLVGLLAALQAYMLALIVGRAYTGQQTLEMLAKPLGILLGIILLRGFAYWWEERQALHLAGGVQQRLRLRVLQKMERLGPVRLREERHGSLLVTLTEGLDTLEVYFKKYLPQLVKSAILPLAYLILVFPQDWITGLTMAITAPLVPVFMSLIGMWTRKQTRKQWSVLAKMSGYFQDILQGLPTLKLFGQTRGKRETIAEISDDFRKVNLQVLRWGFLSALVLELITTISIALIAVSLGLRLIDGSMNFPLALFLLFLAPDFYLPLRSLGSQYHNSLNGAEAAKEIFSFLAEEDAALPLEGDAQPKNGDIRFENVSFAYGNNDNALSGLSFTLREGEKVGLVGPSGSGKTTLLHLLAGFLHAAEGEISLGDVPLSRIGGQALRTQIAMAPQSPYLFQDSVLENIRMGFPGNDDDVVALCRRIGADAFIQKLPQGYDTQIGQGGHGLSGGESQLIAIARACYKDAPIVLLDEATQNMDWETDRLVQKALRHLTAGKTVIAVAHRLQTVAEMDRILVLENGILCEDGAPAVLRKKGGVFAALLPAETGAPTIAPLPEKPATTSTPAAPEEESPPPQKEKAVSIRRMLALCLPYKRVMIVAAALGVAAIGANSALLGFSSLLITQASYQPPVLDLMQVIVGVRFFGISRALFRYAERYKSHDATFRILKNLRLWYYDHMEKLSYVSLRRLGMGRVFQHIISDVEILKFFFLRVLIVPVIAGVILLGTSLFLGFFSWKLAALTCIMFAVCGIVLPVFYRRLFHHKRKNLQAQKQRYSEQLYDYIAGLADAALFGSLSTRAEDILSVGEEIVQQQQRVGAWDGFSEVATSLFANLTLWGTLLITIPLVVQGQISGTVLAALCWVAWASFEALQPVAAAAEYLEQSQQALEGMEDATTRPREQQGQGSEHFSPEQPLFAENLSFSYKPNTPVLQDISFTLPPGSKTAVIGQSGAGKTTLLDILIGFLPYQQGSVRSGQTEFRDISPKELRRNIGYLGQHPYLFHTTVRENILLAREDADESEMRQAAQSARINDFFSSLPEGYDTIVGENGYRLSAGQRQRVALAQLFLQDAPMIVLDEPTQNLDSENRNAIFDALQNWWQEKTVLYITHDLHGLESMDQILVLEAGRIAERGTHRQLLDKGGLYARYYSLERHSF